MPTLPEVTVVRFTYDWTGPSGFTSNDENPVILNPEQSNAGIYVLTVTGTTGCTATDSVEVVIEELGAPQLETQMDTSCFGDTIYIEATAYNQDVVYRWFEGVSPGGTPVDSTTVPVFTFLPSDTGAYSVYVIVEAEECTSDPSMAISIQVLSLPVAAVAQELVAVCTGDTVQLVSENDAPGVTYMWTGPNGFSSGLQSPVVTTDAASAVAGEYFLVVEENGCASEPVTVTVTVADMPLQPVIDGTPSICGGDTLELNIIDPQGADQFLWVRPGDGETILTQEGFLQVPGAGVLDSGGWLVTGFQGGCASIQSAPFQVDIEALNIEAGNTGPACVGDQVMLTVDTIADASYSWTGPGGFSSNEQSPVITPLNGEYIVTVTSLTGCSEVDTTLVQVSQQPAVTAISSTAGVCATGLDDVEFQITVFPVDTGNYTYAWNGPAGFTSDQERPVAPGFTSANNGVYSVVVNNGACTSDTASILVTVTDVPPPPGISGSTEVCEGDTIVLIATGTDPTGSTYIWTTPLGNDTTFQDSILILPGVQLAAGGTYTVQVMQDICESLPSEGLEVSVIPELAAPAISGPESVCEGDTLMLCGEGPPDAIYFWSGPDGFSSNEQCISIPDMADANAGTYFLSVEAGPCRSPEASHDVALRPKPLQPEIETVDVSFCLDNPMPFTLCIDAQTATVGATYVWLNATSGDTLSDSGLLLCAEIDEFDSFGPGLNGIVAIAALDGCDSEVSLPLAVKADESPDEPADAGPDQVICPGEVANLQGIAPVMGGGTWTTTDPEVIISDPNDPNTLVSGLREGENVFTWSLDYESCTNYSSDSVVIVVRAAPVAVFDSVFVDFGQPAEFNVLDNDVIEGPVSIQVLADPARGNLLTPGNGNFIYTPDIGFVGQDNFIYEVCSEDCPGECSEASVLLQVGDENDCFVPTIFTPNNDGVNDELIIPCLETDRYPDNYLKVFNQWGGEVYSASPYLNDWRGRFNGNDLPVGTYYYVLDFADGSPVRRGFIIIDR